MTTKRRANLIGADELNADAKFRKFPISTEINYEDIEKDKEMKPFKPLELIEKPNADIDPGCELMDSYFYPFRKCFVMNDENLTLLMLKDFKNVKKLPNILDTDELEVLWPTILDDVKKYYKGLIHAHRMF